MITEIAPDVYRICIYVRNFDLQFNHFLVRDEEPLLFHAGLRSTFAAISDAVRQVLDPSTIRWIGYSHFDAGECSALNQWLRVAPHARPVHGHHAGAANMADCAEREPLVLAPSDALSTGRYRFRFIPTPHLRHDWDAGMLFEETAGTLFGPPAAGELRLS